MKIEIKNVKFAQFVDVPAGSLIKTFLDKNEESAYIKCEDIMNGRTTEGYANYNAIRMSDGKAVQVPLTEICAIIEDGAE